MKFVESSSLSDPYAIWDRQQLAKLVSAAGAAGGGVTLAPIRY